MMRAPAATIERRLRSAWGSQVELTLDDGKTMKVNAGTIRDGVMSYRVPRGLGGGRGTIALDRIHNVVLVTS